MDLLDHLHQRLLAATAASSAEGTSPGLTIADLYQRLIPYRSVRGEMAVMELAEYEHALLRLLAGERRYLELGESAVTAEFRRELSSPHPILGIYRDYAGVEVRVSTGEPGAVGPPPATLREAPDATAAPAPPQDAASPSVARGETAAQPSRSPTPPRTRCHACTRILPGIPDVLFCPFCGEAQGPASCASCGATVQEGWDFCVRCGTGRRPRSRGT